MMNRRPFLLIIFLILSFNSWCIVSQAEGMPSVTISGDGLTASIPTKARITGAVRYSR